MVFRRFTVLWLSLALLASACTSMRHYRPGYSEFERGLALFDQGRFDDAIPHFRRATAEDPEFGEAFLYLGRAYLNTRRWRDAIQPLRAAYRLSPAETKDEVFNFLLDALFAAGAGSLPGDRSRDTDRRQDRP
jgi:tetratricopeptide (TPR) repeat protein